MGPSAWPVCSVPLWQGPSPMRFPSHPGGLAGLTLDVPDLAAAQPFLRGVLHAPGYYSIALEGPDSLGVALEVVHAWDDLPELRDGGERVRLPGADGITLGGYLHRPADGAVAGVVVMPGYCSDATATSWTAAQLAREGFAALSLSKRGWLGSEGDEDQGLRQPDDTLAAAGWLRAQPGCGGPVALLGYSQGGQVALLAAGAELLAAVAFFPYTDMAAWARESEASGIADYLADFVAPGDMAACSPVAVAGRIHRPVLLVHGDADRIVPVARSRAMVAANPGIRLEEVPGAAHAFTQAQYDAERKRTVAFLRECLGQHEGLAR